MMKSRTYPRRGVHGEIVHAIGAQILRGDLRPGDPLPTEEDLIADLAVSRTALRESIKVLAAKGLVEARPKTGTRVRDRHYWNLMDPDVLVWTMEASSDGAFFRDVNELRRILEPAAARLAADRAEEAELDAIAASFAELETAAADADVEA